MFQIPYTYRRSNGRYQYRRKVDLTEWGVHLITWSLRTSTWSVARIRAAAVTAALDRVVYLMRYSDFSIGVRAASQANLFLKRVADFAMGTATQGYFDPSTDPDLVTASCLIHADLHDLAARHAGVAVLDAEEEMRLREMGRDDLHMARLRQLVAMEGEGLLISDISLVQRMRYLDIPLLEGGLQQDRLLMHRGIREGQLRAMHFNDPVVRASGDELAYLMEHGGALVAREGVVRSSAVRPAAHTPEPAEEKAGDGAAPMLGTLIDGIVDDRIAQKDWSKNVGEDARRLLKQFVWMIGDRPCTSYNQTDVNMFKREMLDMPKTIRVQSVWAKPYAQVKKGFAKITDANRRSDKTLNKDLTYLASFAKQMAGAGYWPENFIKPLALKAKVTAEQKASGRLPWRVEHIEKMFASPIYMGNGGSKRRLRPGRYVDQDATYWLLLLAAYQLGRRDEHAGHLISDFVFDQGTPHMLIRENALRKLKTSSSHRFIPIHPRLLELGLREYVEAVAATGEDRLFPELWINAGKKGGDQYYALCWRKLMVWLEGQGLPIPVTPEGKQADLHSVRATGLSQLDRIDINQNIVKDIAGHAREGTTARSYQKLLESGGLEDVLQERLKVLLRLPDYAKDVVRRPFKLLAVALRSR